MEGRVELRRRTEAAKSAERLKLGAFREVGLVELTIQNEE